MNDPKHYDTGEDAIDTHDWAFDTEYDRARHLRFIMVLQDHDCTNSATETSCTVCSDAYAMNDHELLVKYQGKVRV